jgi:hypothetical protein
MLMELFILFQLALFIFFLVGFITHNEIVWASTAILGALTSYCSLSIQYYVYEVGKTAPYLAQFSYPFIAYFDGMLAIIAIVMAIFDVFDKYGSRSKRGLK